MNELVSIVMPLYNCEAFLTDSIDSVIAQTYEKWELIIIDDCSSDKSELIAKEYSKQDSRIRVFKNERNRGAAISRNYALSEAKGRWIAFLDADDLWEENKLEKQIKYMTDNGYCFTYTMYSEIAENGNDTGMVVSGPKKINKIGMKVFNFLGCLTVIYDAHKVGVIQIPDLKKRNDWALWLKIIKHSPCYLFQENLAKYRVRKSGSITHIKGGKIKLLKYHYIMFRESENMCVFEAMFWSGLNLIFGVLKRRIYCKDQTI